MPQFKHIFLAILLFGSLGHNLALANPLMKGLKGRGVLEQPQLDNRFNASPVQPRISAREAIGIAERRYGGRAVGAQEITTASGSAYRVRILQDNGKIKNVIISGN